MANFALDAKHYFDSVDEEAFSNVKLKIGLHHGPGDFSGIMGSDPIVYDIWEIVYGWRSCHFRQWCVPVVHASGAFYERTCEQFHFIQRDPIHLRGIGKATSYSLTARKK